MDSLGYFLIGLGIPLILVLIFWKELRARRERVIKLLKRKFNK